MYDADPVIPIAEIDQLFVETRFASVEPVREQRCSGEIFESPMLGRLEFSRMPYGRPSFWRGEQVQPDNRFPLQIVCEVEGDDLPGADQGACVTAFRRLQVQDAILCAPLINARLRDLHFPRTIGADDLILTAIHLPPHPLTDARFELGFRAITAPRLIFTIVFLRGMPRTVRVDSDA